MSSSEKRPLVKTGLGLETEEKELSKIVVCHGGVCSFVVSRR
jgi:hypothetical protein